MRTRLVLLLAASVIVAAAACGGSVSTGNGKPPVAVTAASVGGLVGIPTRFDGSASYDPDGSIASWTWDFGDGHTASGKTAQHVYAAAGSSYAASLTVKDDSGNSDQKAIAVTVQPVSAIAGNWSLTANPTVTTCSNGGYAVAFPAPGLAVTVSNATIDATASGSGMQLVGSFDVSGKLIANATTTTTTYSCVHGGTPATLVDHKEALTATFGGASFLGGKYSLILDWNDVFCNCAKIFDVTGTK